MIRCSHFVRPALLAALIAWGPDPREVRAVAPATAPSDGSAAPAPAVRAEEPAGPAGQREATLERLKALPEPPADEKAKGEPAAELRRVLEERLKLLDALDKARKAREAAEHPGTTPEREREELAAELTRLEREDGNPSVELPEAFRRDDAARVAALAEMREAISAAQDALRDHREALESQRGEVTRKAAGPLAELKARRDVHRNALAALTAVGARLEGELATAGAGEGRALVREKVANAEIETRVHAEGLREIDALLRQESDRSKNGELRLQTLTARVTHARRVLEAMQARYEATASRQQGALERAASFEQARAKRLNDPVERYRAARGAMLLDLRVLLLREEKVLASTPALSAVEQSALAKQGREDLENLRALIAGGRSTTLVALRLTNSYRRLAQERENVVNHELVEASQALAHFENQLTEVELDILSDSREDRVEFESLLARLHKSRHKEAQAAFEGIEEEHRDVLEKRRRVLSTLAKTAEETRAAVLSRIAVLDEQYAFIRTHIFWVRDAQPIGLATLVQCDREGRVLARAAWLLVTEPWRGPIVRSVSAEFVVAFLAALALPIFLHRARRLLLLRLARAQGARPVPPAPAPA